MPDRLSFRVVTASPGWMVAGVVLCAALARGGWPGAWLAAGFVWAVAVVEELHRLPLPASLGTRDDAYGFLLRQAAASLVGVGVVSLMWVAPLVGTVAPLGLGYRIVAVDVFGLVVGGGVVLILFGAFILGMQARIRFVTHVLDALESTEAGERRHVSGLAMLACVLVPAVFVAVVFLRLRPLVLEATGAEGAGE